jgi:hypothetical protein
LTNQSLCLSRDFADRSSDRHSGRNYPSFSFMSPDRPRTWMVAGTINLTMANRCTG